MTHYIDHTTIVLRDPHGEDDTFVEKEVTLLSRWDRLSPIWRTIIVTSLVIMGLIAVSTWISFSVRTPIEGNQVFIEKLIRKSAPPNYSSIMANTNTSADNNVCSTSDCLDLALELLRVTNFSVDPCQNFYEFACGNGQEISEPSDIQRFHNDLDIQAILESPENSEDVKPLNQAKQFYVMCVGGGSGTSRSVLDINWFSTLRDLIQHRIGGWPAINPENWDDTQFNLTRSMITLHELHLTPLTHVYVYQDLKNSSRHIVHLTQPELLLPQEVFLNQTVYRDRIHGLTLYFVQLAQTFIRQNYPYDDDVVLGLEKKVVRHVTKKDLQIAANEVIQFCVDLAKISQPLVTTFGDPLRGYNLIKLNQLFGQQDHFTNNWKNFLTTIFDRSGVKIGDDELIVVDEPEYFINLKNLMTSTNQKVIANYFAFLTMSTLAPEAPVSLGFTDFVLEFEQLQFGHTETITREAHCTQMTQNIFGMAIASKFVAQNLDMDIKAEGELMMENVREAFKQRFAQSSSWMDEKTEEGFQKKLASMKKFVGYPDWIFEGEKMEELYKGIYLYQNNYVRSLLGIRRWSFQKMLKRLRERPNGDL